RLFCVTDLGPLRKPPGCVTRAASRFVKERPHGPPAPPHAHLFGPEHVRGIPVHCPLRRRQTGYPAGTAGGVWLPSGDFGGRRRLYLRPAVRATPEAASPRDRTPGGAGFAGAAL